MNELGRVADKSSTTSKETISLAPQTTFQAVLRGARNRCPSCGQAQLFRAFLKPIETCPVCAEDWSRQSADDFPAYISILLTGHLSAPVIIALVSETALPTWAIGAIMVTMILALSIALIQPSKGAIMALLWKLGVNGNPTAKSVASNTEKDP